MASTSLPPFGLRRSRIQDRALNVLKQSLAQLSRAQSPPRPHTAADRPKPAPTPPARHSTWAAQVLGLHKRFGSTPSLQGLSLHLPQGSIYGLLGPNGAGKTTTLQVLATLLRPDQGEVHIAGVDAVRHPRRARTLLGYVGQECAVDKVLTGREHLHFQADLHHLSDAELHQRSDELIEQLGMGDWIDRRSGGYSGGMRRRLDLACGLIHRPRLLLLDEPTVGLDPESRSAIWQVLQQLRAEGTSILLSSHYLEEIEALADQVGILEGGRMLAEGAPDVLKASLGGDHISLKLREFTTAAEAEQAQRLLQNCPGVRRLVIDADQGHSLHLVVDGPGVIDQLRACLREAELPIFSLSHARPSLDDIYIQATGRNLNDADRRASANRDYRAERRRAMR